MNKYEASIKVILTILGSNVPLGLALVASHTAGMLARFSWLLFAFSLVAVAIIAGGKIKDYLKN